MIEDLCRGEGRRWLGSTSAGWRRRRRSRTGYLNEWLARGYAGEMIYLHKSAATRADVRQFLPSARSVIVTGTLYNTDGPDSARERASRSVRRMRSGLRATRGATTITTCISRSARGAGRVDADAAGRAVRRRHFVDTAPVQERVYAQ